MTGRSIWLGPVFLGVCWGNLPEWTWRYRNRCLAIAVGSVSVGIGIST